MASALFRHLDENSNALAIVATCVHAWIGMWTIGTDYLRGRTMGPKGDSLRSIYQWFVS